MEFRNLQTVAYLSVSFWEFWKSWAPPRCLLSSIRKILSLFNNNLDRRISYAFEEVENVRLENLSSGINVFVWSIWRQLILRVRAAIFFPRFSLASRVMD